MKCQKPDCETPYDNAREMEVETFISLAAGSDPKKYKKEIMCKKHRDDYLDWLYNQKKGRIEDHDIEVKDLIPPIGEYKYFAVFKVFRNGAAETIQKFKEVYGKTREEARERMLDKAQDWISKN